MFSNPLFNIFLSPNIIPHRNTGVAHALTVEGWGNGWRRIRVPKLQQTSLHAKPFGSLRPEGFVFSSTDAKSASRKRIEVEDGLGLLSTNFQRINEWAARAYTGLTPTCYDSCA